ncbi:hypothetical protein PC121_g7037 [Phytophthora cactorum]|nr:hypothetical protein PC121_g7037 [Phytophthora cactorum]
MPKKGARSSKPSTSATKGNVVKGMTKKKERPSKTKPRANSPRDDAPAADAATRSSPGPTANQPASAPGEIASAHDASSGPLGKSTRASATDKETPAGGANCASPGPTLSSSPARAAKEKAPASRSSTGLPKTKQHASTHDEKALAYVHVNPSIKSSPPKALQRTMPVMRITIWSGIRTTDWAVISKRFPGLFGRLFNVKRWVLWSTADPIQVAAPRSTPTSPRKWSFEASIRRFVQAARVEAEKEAASSHTAAQDDTEMVSGQVNVEAIDGDAEPIVETNATEGKTSSLDADSNTQHNDAVNNENNNEITSQSSSEKTKTRKNESILRSTIWKVVKARQLRSLV